MLFARNQCSIRSLYVARLLVSQFVGDGVRQRDAVILVDAATAIRLAHASDVRHPEGAAGCIRARTNVLPRYEDRHIVMIRMRIVAGIQLLLPLAEIVQSFVRVHRDVQPLLGQKGDLSRVIEARRGAPLRGITYCWCGCRERTYLRVVLLEQNDSDYHDVDEIADRRVEVKRGHHVHDGQQIGLHVAVLMKGHHRRVGDDEGLDVTRCADRSLGTVPPFRLVMFPPPAALNLNEARLSLPLEPRLCQSTRFCRIFHVPSRSMQSLIAFRSLNRQFVR